MWSTQPPEQQTAKSASRDQTHTFMRAPKVNYLEVIPLALDSIIGLARSYFPEDIRVSDRAQWCRYALGATGANLLDYINECQFEFLFLLFTVP